MLPVTSIDPVAPAAVNASPAREVRRNAGHLYWVDWLRFLAAAVVVVDHTRMLNWREGLTPDGQPPTLALGVFTSLTQLGRPAVIVFFVLSGLLVGGKTLARVRRGTFDASAYAADRLSRIYVPLVPALLLTAAVVRGYDMPFHPAHFLACLISLQGVYVEKPLYGLPLWTLPYEVWCYVLTGCLAAACVRGGPTGRRLAAVAGAALALGVLRRLDPAYVLCWTLGVAGFWLRDRIKRGRAWWIAAGAAVAGAAVVMDQMNLGLLSAPPGLPLPPEFALKLAVAAGALVAVACLMPLAPASRAGAWIERLGTRLAAFSYTLYLVHYPVLCLLAVPSASAARVDGPSLGRAGAWMAACFGAALVMYALFEARTLPVRRWLRARFDGTRGAVFPHPSTPAGVLQPVTR